MDCLRSGRDCPGTPELGAALDDLAGAGWLSCAKKSKPSSESAGFWALG